MVDPFVFVAGLSANALTLLGSVPSEDARNRCASCRANCSNGRVSPLQVASGAPKNWDQAVAAALKALSYLFGKISLSGVAVTIEGVAPAGTATAVSDQLGATCRAYSRPQRASAGKKHRFRPACRQNDPAHQGRHRHQSSSAHGDLAVPKPVLESE